MIGCRGLVSRRPDTSPSSLPRTIPARILRALFPLALAMIILHVDRAPVLSAEPGIGEVVLTNSSREVLLYFRLVNCFMPELEKAVENGVPATFTFEIELERARPGLPDREVVRQRFDHTMIYDNLKEEYRIILGEHGGRTYATRSLDDARRVMASVNGLPVIELGRLVPGVDYVLRARARSENREVPSAFYYLVPFMRNWNFETEWHRVEFRY